MIVYRIEPRYVVTGIVAHAVYVSGSPISILLQLGDLVQQFRVLARFHTFILLVKVTVTIQAIPVLADLDLDVILTIVISGNAIQRTVFVLFPNDHLAVIIITVGTVAVMQG